MLVIFQSYKHDKVWLIDNDCGHVRLLNSNLGRGMMTETTALNDDLRECVLWLKSFFTFILFHCDFFLWDRHLHLNPRDGSWPNRRSVHRVQPPGCWLLHERSTASPSSSPPATAPCTPPPSPPRRQPAPGQNWARCWGPPLSRSRWGGGRMWEGRPAGERAARAEAAAYLGFWSRSETLSFFHLILLWSLFKTMWVAAVAAMTATEEGPTWCDAGRGCYAW